MLLKRQIQGLLDSVGSSWIKILILWEVLYIVQECRIEELRLFHGYGPPGIGLLVTFQLGIRCIRLVSGTVKVFLARNAAGPGSMAFLESGRSRVIVSQNLHGIDFREVGDPIHFYLHLQLVSFLRVTEDLNLLTTFLVYINPFHSLKYIL